MRQDYRRPAEGGLRRFYGCGYYSNRFHRTGIVEFDEEPYSWL